MREPIGNLAYEHDQACGVFDRIHAVSDIAGMRFAAVHGAAKAMRTLVGNDGLHGSRLADHASCRTNAIFFEIANQSAHAEATDLLVVTQGVMQWSVQSVLVQCGKKFWRLRQSDADKAFHVRGPAAVHATVVDPAAPRVVVRPIGFRATWNDIDMPVEQKRASAAGARQDAHAVLAANEMEYDWDFAGGEAEYKKAFELDPNDATAHQWHAEDIGWIGGRAKESIAEIDRAHELDPLSPIISVEAGHLRATARQYDEAIVICQRVANENPTFARAHLCLAQSYWGKGMYPQVVEQFKLYGQFLGDRNEADFAFALEQGFHAADWKGALTKAIEARQAQRKTGYSSAYNIAVLYAGLGDKDEAFKWLNTAYQERDWQLEALKTDFLLDPLRSDPRFADLVRKVGLPQ